MTWLTLTAAPETTCESWWSLTCSNCWKKTRKKKPSVQFCFAPQTKSERTKALFKLTISPRQSDAGQYDTCTAKRQVGSNTACFNASRRERDSPSSVCGTGWPACSVSWSSLRRCQWRGPEHPARQSGLWQSSRWWGSSGSRGRKNQGNRHHVETVNLSRHQKCTSDENKCYIDLHIYICKWTLFTMGLSEG